MDYKLRGHSSAESGITRSTVTGELVLLVSWRFSPPAMRQESHLPSAISVSPFETWRVPSSATYIFSSGDDDSVVPPPGAITDTPIHRSEEGPASLPCRRTIAMS